MINHLRTTEIILLNADEIRRRSCTLWKQGKRILIFLGQELDDVVIVPTGLVAFVFHGD
jgi:hypothetical protein